jgi:hypothetical protein
VQRLEGRLEDVIERQESDFYQFGVETISSVFLCMIDVEADVGLSYSCPCMHLVPNCCDVHSAMERISVCRRRK